MKEYYIYIITNLKKSVLYIGMTNDLTKRLDQHFQDSKNLKKSFAWKYNCYHLVYFEKLNSPSEAILREKTLKKWRREKKIRLIEAYNPEWKFLEKDIL